MLTRSRGHLFSLMLGIVSGVWIGGAHPFVQAAQGSRGAHLDPATVQRAWDGLAASQTASFLIKTDLPNALRAELTEQVDELLDRTEEAVGRILSLSSRGPHRFKLSVFATREAYQAYVSAIMTPSLRESVVEHSGGFFSVMRNEIVVACPEETFRTCRGTLAHEFTHALAGRTSFMAGGERVSWSEIMPPWLDEGLAEYVSAQVEGGRALRWDILKAALKDGTLIPLATLIDTQSRPLEHPLFYPSALSLVTWLIDRDPSGSPERVKRYLQVIKAKRFATDQFVTAFGSLQEVEPAWHQFIASGDKHRIPGTQY